MKATGKTHGNRKVIVVWMNDPIDDELTQPGDTFNDRHGSHPTNPGDIKLKRREEQEYIFDRYAIVQPDGVVIDRIKVTSHVGRTFRVEYFTDKENKFFNDDDRVKDHAMKAAKKSKEPGKPPKEF